MKSRTSLFVIGILIAMLAASILTVLVLFVTGSFGKEKPELEFTVNAVEAKEYDGTPLKATGFSWTSGEKELKEGHRVEGTIYGSQTNRGTSETDLRVKVYDENDIDVTNEYSVKVNNCDLTVLPKEILVVFESDQIPYSGKEIAIEKYRICKAPDSEFVNSSDLEDDKLIDGHKLVVTFPGKFENVGDKLPDSSEWTEENVKIYDAAGNVVTNNYKLKWNTNVNIQIVPRIIRVNALDTMKYYDGKPIQGKWELASDSVPLAEGDYIGDVQFVGEDGKEVSLTNVDSKRVKVKSCSVYRQDGYDLVPSENYVIEESEAYGTLTVIERPVTIMARNVEKVYDGYKLYEEKSDADAPASLADTEVPYYTDLPSWFTLHVNSDIVDVCNRTYTFDDVRITLTDENGDSVDVTDQFHIKQEPGIVKIKPIIIESELKSIEKQKYTGKIFNLTIGDVIGDAFLESIKSYCQADDHKLESNLRDNLMELTADKFQIVSDEPLKNAKIYHLGVEFKDVTANDFGGRENVTFEYPPATFEIEKADIQLEYGTGDNVNKVTHIYNGKEATFDCRNFVVKTATPETPAAETGGTKDFWTDKVIVSSASFVYDELGNHALSRNEVYPVTVNDVQIKDKDTSDVVTDNFNVTTSKINVKIDAKTIIARLKNPSLKKINLSVEAYPSNPNELVKKLVNEYQDKIDFDGLISGDNIDYNTESSPIKGKYNSTTHTVIIYAEEIESILNEDSEEVTDCYDLENAGDSYPLITIQLTTP